MKPIVIFGTGKIAEVLLYFFRNHSDRHVVACTVDHAYISDPQWEGLPTCSFKDVAQKYPPQTYDMFVALGYQNMNALRASKCAEARQLGYTLASYVHPDSGLPTDCIHGDNCFIMNQVHIHPRVSFGNNVFIWSGAMVGHHTTLGDNCWLTSCTNISGLVTVGANCFFAVNATVGHSISIGEYCFIGANTLVIKSTQPHEVYVTEATHKFRLDSKQFLRISNF
jgi:sugar O-acyltransferase (sialic acid O-acetyltransferase NeuD family)